MIEVQGKYTNAKIFTDNIEAEALSQVYKICNHPIFEGETVRIMPDVHAGKGCVIGFTATNRSGKLIPNLIGVDIGCAMLTCYLGKVDLDFQDIDKYIQTKIPHGFNVNSKQHVIPYRLDSEIKQVCSLIKDEKYNYHRLSIGSLGGGNHFIEFNEDSEGNKYLVIHSGSRNFGHKIATYYQKQAAEYCKQTNKHVESGLEYLEGDLAGDYKFCVETAQKFAAYSRHMMMISILNHLSILPDKIFETVHNYIDKDIIRKGAISAKMDELVLIPLNMRDGSIMAIGRGNEDWNCSAPHGAGRRMSRKQAKEHLNIHLFVESMEGIYTSCVRESTLDEAPMAYKGKEEIINNVGDSLVIMDIIKPIYNFKS